MNATDEGKHLATILTHLAHFDNLCQGLRVAGITIQIDESESMAARQYLKDKAKRLSDKLVKLQELKKPKAAKKPVKKGKK